MVAVSGKKKSIAKTVALNCISLEAYRATHHVQTQNATWENRTVRNVNTRYRAMLIWVGNQLIEINGPLSNHSLSNF